MSDIVIVSATRSAIGKFGGSLKDISAVDMATQISKSAIKKANLTPNQIDNVIFGNVLQAGNGQNPARQIAVNSGIPYTTPAMTINEVCGSGLKSVILGIQSLKLNDATAVLVGGTESMSNAPYYLTNERWGARYGHKQTLDSIMHDGLTDAFSGDLMGITAENIAEQFTISRAQQDEFALQSHQKAVANRQYTANEITPLTVKTRKGSVDVVLDESIRDNIDIDALGALSPVFLKDGTVTSGNASPLNDGAAAMILTTREFANKHALPVLASIVDYAEIGNDPSIMGFAPYHAVSKLLEKTGLTIDNFDAIESNEAFAAQSLAVLQHLNVDSNKVNQFGGAIALGHPLGASGTRIIVTLLNVLKQTNGSLGLATLCVGGGIGLAIAIKNEQ